MDLGKVELFKGLEKEEIDSLLDCLGCRTCRYSKGEIILREGEACRRLGIVLAGEVGISSCDLWGNLSILSKIEAGGIFAESYAFLENESLMVSATALDETEVLFLSAEKILSPCFSACPVHLKLMKNLIVLSSRKNLELSRRSFYTSPKSIRGRLLTYFSFLSRKSGAPSFLLPFNRQELASYLNVDRSAMTTELYRMQHEGLVEIDKRRITIIEEWEA